MMHRPIARRPLLALAAGFCGVAVAVASARPVLAPLQEPVQAPPSDVIALFHTHCASCHGETGDGKGWTELDRPARSFKDGGFSFGNTPDTIARTITGGIPGTPMPGFDAALTVDEIKALARHVIALGPPELPAPERTEMIVLDRPLVARGKLPPIVRGAPERPRGLLVGTLDGLTFEYDAEDVRLVGVRQGRFVDRRDWGDRGGAALEPLGKPVYVVEDGKPGVTFSMLAGREGERVYVDLKSSLTGTRIVGGRTSVLQTLRAPDGAIVAHVEETPERITTELGTGFRRVYALRAERPVLLRMRLPVLASAGREMPPASGIHGGPRGFLGWLMPTSEGRCLFAILGGHGDVRFEWSNPVGGVAIELEPGGEKRFELIVLPLSADADVEAISMLELHR